MSNNQKSASTPAYVAFARALRERCAELGLEPTTADTETGLPQNKGYAFLEFGPHGGGTPAIIIPKSVGRMANCHLHVDASGLDGYVPLPKDNGRVLCHFVPDVDLLTPVIRLLVGASKRPVAVPGGRASQAPVAQTPKFLSTKEETEAELRLINGEMTDGEKELASWQ